MQVVRWAQQAFGHGLVMTPSFGAQSAVSYRATLHPISVQDYLKQRNLPYHSLYKKGYASIGDVHSTRPLTVGQNERDSRFNGLRQECGLHLPKTAKENESRASSSLSKSNSVKKTASVARTPHPSAQPAKPQAPWTSATWRRRTDWPWKARPSLRWPSG